MPSSTPPRVLVAHRRAPVQRLLKTNLEAERLGVLVAGTPSACLSALRSGVDALVLDAELVRGDRPESATLLRYLLGVRVPTLLVSWVPSDWPLARTLHGAPFTSRPDDVDGVLNAVHDLLGVAARA